MRAVNEDVVRSVVCLCVCLSVSCAKTAEPIEISFGELTCIGPGNRVLDRGMCGRHLVKETFKVNIASSARCELVHTVFQISDDTSLIF